jgi:hypothetical protein
LAKGFILIQTHGLKESRTDIARGDYLCRNKTRWDETYMDIEINLIMNYSPRSGVLVNLGRRPVWCV